MNPQVKVEGLCFQYQETEILKDISFVAEQGHFISIIGPNGSGKSTLLKNISAALTPCKGVVYMEKDNIFALRPRDLAQKMAVVPQDTGVQFPFSIMETVLMGRMPHKKRFQGENAEDLSIAQWAMEVTDTWKLKDRLITDISGGERQRVIVARALAQEPQVLLLDEPTAFLDLQHQFGLLELLHSFTQAGRLTVIAVLHDLNLAAQYSDEIILLDQAKIFAAGKPEDVLTQQNIRQIYKIEALLSPNHLTGRFNIIPVARSVPKAQKEMDCKIHLICGGGTGTHIMDKLVQDGYQVSCGVVNIGDSDWNKAKSLGIPLVEEAPFANIKPDIYAKNKVLIDQADVIIVLPIPFGIGNVGNLRQAEEALAKGKQVILVGENHMLHRDFTEGEATDIYQTLLQNQAKSVSYTKDVFALLNACGKQKQENNKKQLLNIHNIHKE